MCDQWRHHCTNQWRGRCHWVSRCSVWRLHSKWLSECSSESTSKICVKLEHSSTETIHMIQKAAGMGNWWWAASSRQHACLLRHHVSCRVSRRVFWWNIRSPRFGALWLLAAPKTKITYEREKDFRLSVGFRRIQWGSWLWLGELCEVPRCLLWRELRRHCPNTMFLVSCIFNKCLYFTYHMAGYFLDRPCVINKIISDCN